MDSMEINKAIAAILVAGIAFFVTGMLGDSLVQESLPAKPAIAIQGAQEAAAKPEAAAGPAPIAPLLASADVKAGEKYASTVCAACHSFDQGGPNKVGPDLYGVLGRPVASHPGFDYSSALQAKKGPWTYDELNDWLYKPSAYAAGTKMSFPGIPDDKKRADVIAYLRTLSPNPEPLPKPEAKPGAAAAPAAAAPAAPAAAAAAAPGGESIATLLAKADPAAGEKYAKNVCGACHTFNKGGAAGMGPNLYGIVGDPHGHMAGFDYSPGLKAKQGPWTFDELNQWLTNPASYAPGTKMAFPGIKDPEKRADVIAFLDKNSDHPEPLPSAQPAAAKPAAAPAAAAPAAPAPAPAATQPAQPSGTTPQGAGGAEEKGGQQMPPLTNQGGAPAESPQPAAKSP